MAKRSLYEVEYLYACTGAVMGSSCFVYAKNAREAHFIWLVLATVYGWNYADITKSGYWNMREDIKEVEYHDGCVFDMNDAVEVLNGQRGEYLYAVLPRCPGIEVPADARTSPDYCYHDWKPIIGAWTTADACCTKCGALMDEHGVWKPYADVPVKKRSLLRKLLDWWR